MASSSSLQAAPDIVFVHGLKAGCLADGRGKNVYLTIPNLLGLTTPDLSLPTEFDESTGWQCTDDFRPSVPLSNIGFKFGLPLDKPLITLAKVYSPFLEWSAAYAAKNECQHHDFVWDWRREISEANAKLEQFLEEVVAKSGRAPQIVCHSAGALVTFPLLNRRPDLIHSVLFAAGALDQGMLLGQDMSTPGGRSEFSPFQKSIITPSTWFTNPAVFAWCPTNGSTLTGSGLPHLTEADHVTPIDRDYCEIETFKELKIGPFHPNSEVQMTPEREAFFVLVLDRAREYRKTVRCDETATYPPIECLICNTVPTVDGYARTEDGRWLFDTAGSRMVPGDGVIGAKSAVPPAGVPHNVTYTEFDHANILSDPVVGSLLQKMRDAKSSGERPVFIKKTSLV